ncbi:uncharacterized protein [Montipora foliosa]|uniref:uncharacterized protein n=1 Tax=Montipora foliosa TaxID=591990 RepID=UPI0035F1B9E7
MKRKNSNQTSTSTFDVHGVRGRFRAPERDAVTLTESVICWSPRKKVQSPPPHIKYPPQLVKLDAKKKKISVGNKNDSYVGAKSEIAATTAPRLISTGATVGDMQSLVLAAEGMVVFPNGLDVHSKNIYLFLEYILIPELRRSNHSLPISVEPVVCKLNRMT